MQHWPSVWSMYCGAVPRHMGMPVHWERVLSYTGATFRFCGPPFALFVAHRCDPALDRERPQHSTHRRLPSMGPRPAPSSRSIAACAAAARRALRSPSCSS